MNEIKWAQGDKKPPEIVVNEDTLLPSPECKKKTFLRK